MPPLHLFYALLVVMLWGANFVASKFALAYFPPVTVTALRFAVLALVMLPFVRRPDARQMRFLALLSVAGAAHFLLPQASLAAGLGIATCAILNQLSVPFACLLGVMVMKEQIGVWRLFGMGLAFFGMLVVFGSPHISGSWLGSAYAMGAAFFFGVYNVMMKHHPEITAMQVLAYVCLFGLPQTMLLAWWLESPSFTMVAAAPWLPVASIGYTVIFSSIIGHGLWNYLVRMHPISRVAPFSLLVPIFGVMFGQMFYDEPLTWQLLLGGSMTLVGVGIIVVRRPKLLARGDGV